MIRRLLLALVLVATLASPASAAPRPDPSCSWSPAVVAVGEQSTMTAINLPTNRLVNFTFRPFPSGGGFEHDGTFTLVWTVSQTTTIYIWTRGGGDALFRPGKQLNDYHPIATCTVEVA